LRRPPEIVQRPKGDKAPPASRDALPGRREFYSLLDLMADPRGRKPPKEKTDTQGSLHTRWWIDQGKPRERSRPGPPEKGVTDVSAEKAVAGTSFFSAGVGYDQETARSRLTDLNLKLLEEGSPPPDGWGILQMTPDRFPSRTFEQIKRTVPLKPGMRALAVDSGVSLRVILTGTPPGQRLLELRFGEESSFDAWVHGEWVEEAVFSSLREALKTAAAFVTRYLPPPPDIGDRR
jgi:hypothetical protein